MWADGERFWPENIEMVSDVIANSSVFDLDWISVACTCEDYENQTNIKIVWTNFWVNIWILEIIAELYER